MKSEFGFGFSLENNIWVAGSKQLENGLDGGVGNSPIVPTSNGGKYLLESLC